MYYALSLLINKLSLMHDFPYIFMGINFKPQVVNCKIKMINVKCPYISRPETTIDGFSYSVFLVFVIIKTKSTGYHTSNEDVKSSLLLSCQIDHANDKKLFHFEILNGIPHYIDLRHLYSLPSVYC